MVNSLSDLEKHNRDEATIRYEDIALDKATGCVWRGEKVLFLTPGAYRLLILLLGQPGRIFTREEIREAIGGYPKTRSARTRSVDIHVWSLRLALGPPEVIWTIERIGYGLRAPMLQIPADKIAGISLSRQCVTRQRKPRIRRSRRAAAPALASPKTKSDLP